MTRLEIKMTKGIPSVNKVSSKRRHSIVAADEVTYDQDLESYIKAAMMSPLISTLHILMQLALPFDVFQDTSPGNQKLEWH